MHRVHARNLQPAGVHLLRHVPSRQVHRLHRRGGMPQLPGRPGRRVHRRDELRAGPNRPGAFVEFRHVLSASKQKCSCMSFEVKQRLWERVDEYLVGGVGV